jgi:hypothetical protein
MNTIKCTKCGEEIEISEAFKHQIEESVRDEERKKFDVEIEKTVKDAQEKASKKMEEQYALEMKNLKEDAIEEKERNKKLLTQLEELNDQMRALRRKDEERELEMKKKEAQIEEKVRSESRSQLEEEFKLKQMEKEKQIQDVMKLNEELKRKLEQGSQQTQGEVLELDLEQILQEAFPQDAIEPVAKGVNGADIMQRVMSPSGKTQCGIILWESKRTKNWSEGWITKLKGDARSSGAHVSVLVSMALPDGLSHMGLKNGVWVCARSLVLPMATLLRDRLIEVAKQKITQTHQGRKADLIYEFITSTQFQQQVEAILESYTEMQTQVQKERIAYERSWKAREAQLTRIVMATASMYGKMQGLAGANSLPTLKGLDFMELDSGEVN